MKSKLLAVIVLVVVGLLVSVVFISNTASRANEYNAAVAAAHRNAERNIPYVSVKNYKKAFAMKDPSEELFLEYLTQMEKLGEDYYNMGLSEYLQKFPMSTNAYELNLKRYYEIADYRKVYLLALEAREKGLGTETIRDYFTKSAYQYRYIKNDLDEAYSFLGHYALVKKGDLWGYLTDNSGYLIAPYYSKAAVLLGTSAAVFEENEWQFVNELGFTISRLDGTVDELSFLSNGKILAKKGEKCAFLSSDLVVPEDFPYDDATNFKNSVAAVSQNGKWALVNSDGKYITEFIFDDVIRDEFNTCINNAVIFAKKDGYYHMYDATGRQISETTFEDAHLFASEQPAAVKINGKWGFVDDAGNVVLEAKYEDARSFCCNLAPVFENNEWHYINTSGEVRIADSFDDAKSFSPNGIAAIRQGDTWSYIQLSAFTY